MHLWVVVAALVALGAPVLVLALLLLLVLVLHASGLSSNDEADDVDDGGGGGGADGCFFEDPDSGFCWGFAFPAFDTLKLLKHLLMTMMLLPLLFLPCGDCFFSPTVPFAANNNKHFCLLLLFFVVAAADDDAVVVKLLPLL